MYWCNARRRDHSPNRISFDRHSSLTDLAQRSAYEFRFRLLAGNRSGFTLPVVISSRNDWQNFASRSIFVSQQEFLIDCSGDIGEQARPKHLRFPCNLDFVKREIVGAVSKSEKPIRKGSLQNPKLRYFKPFEFFDHPV